MRQTFLAAMAAMAAARFALEASAMSTARQVERKGGSRSAADASAKAAAEEEEKEAWEARAAEALDEARDLFTLVAADVDVFQQAGNFRAELSLSAGVRTS